jgi:hypothetical protein
MSRKLIFLRATGYDARCADGSTLTFTSMKRDGASVDSEGLLLRLEHPCSLRVLDRDPEDESAIDWFIHHTEFWTQMLPPGPRIFLRTMGWPELWDRGYPNLPSIQFHIFDRDKLVEAILANPVSAVWWIEVANVVEESNHTVLGTQYIAFDDNLWGPNPLLVGEDSWIDECVDRITTEYADREVETRELGPGALTEAILEVVPAEIRESYRRPGSF